jgi:hypothetical protein
MLDLDYMNGSFFRLPEPMLFLYTLVDYIACFKRTFEKWKHQKHEFLHPWIVHCIQKRQMWYGPYTVVDAFIGRKGGLGLERPSWQPSRGLELEKLDLER